MAATTADTTWVSPRTWTTGETVTSTIMNAHVRDQLTALKTPASFYYKANEVSDYTTTSTSFADVDATNLAATFTTGGGMVLVGFHGSFAASTNPLILCLDLLVDGASWGGDDGIVTTNIQGTTEGWCGFVVLLTGLSAASHTVKLRWKTTTGTMTMFAGAGTSGFDVHPQFWGLEI